MFLSRAELTHRVNAVLDLPSLLQAAKRGGRKKRRKKIKKTSPTLSTAGGKEGWGIRFIFYFSLLFLPPSLPLAGVRAGTAQR